MTFVRSAMNDAASELLLELEESSLEEIRLCKQSSGLVTYQSGFDGLECMVVDLSVI